MAKLEKETSNCYNKAKLILRYKNFFQLHKPNKEYYNIQIVVQRSPIILEYLQLDFSIASILWLCSILFCPYKVLLFAELDKSINMFFSFLNELTILNF